MHHKLVKRLFPFLRGKEELLKIFRELFTEEEAMLAINLSFAPEPAEEIASRVGRKAEELIPLLDKMAKKGLVYSDERKGAKRYRVLFLFPGITELQFMKGEENPQKVRLAKMFEEFFEALGEELYEEKTPFPRVLPVESRIPPAVVLPYEVVSHYINDSGYISLSICYCRQQAKLLNRWCKRPLETCMTFGPFAEFVVRQGFGRKVSTKEALEVLNACEEAGLVHLTENCQEKIDFICNCCGCCCYFMRGITKYNKSNSIASSNFFCAVDESSCNGCELCVERCYVKAISIEDGTAKVDVDRCIGCGLCNIICPSDSLALVRKEKLSVPQRDSKELWASIATERFARMSRSRVTG